MSAPSRRTILAAGLALAATGCAGVPTSGPVVAVEGSPGAPRPGGIDVDPQSPTPGAEPELVVAGFLQAMASADDSYRVARSYLTPAAAKAWDPAAGATLYDAEQHSPGAGEQGGRLKAPVIARLDEDGRYTTSHGAVVDHDFGLVRSHGQWRISTPPRGVLVSQFAFARSYASLPLYYLDRRESWLVPDLIHLPGARATPATVLSTLLRGPSRGIAPAVVDPTRGRVGLAGDQVRTGADGVATVTLDRAFGKLAGGVRRQMAAQVVWTLTAFPQVSRVRFRTADGPVTIPGAAEDDSVSADLFSSMVPLSALGDPSVGIVTDGTLARVSEQGRIVAVPGFPSGARPAALAMGRARERWVYTDKAGTGLWVWRPGSQKAERIATGTGLRRPQICTDGSVWCVGARGAGSEVVVVDAAGKALEVDAVGLSGTRVLAFSVSPDMARVALVVERGTERLVAIAPVRVGRGSASVGAAAALWLGVAEAGLAEVLDLGWVSQTDLAVLGRAASATTTNPYRMGLDGSGIASLGPLTGAPMTALATVPRPEDTAAWSLSADGQVLRHEERFRWRPVAGNATALSAAL